MSLGHYAYQHGAGRADAHSASRRRRVDTRSRVWRCIQVPHAPAARSGVPVVAAEPIAVTYSCNDPETFEVALDDPG
jgi:hypothetical protein